jgi:type I restriction enzyme S subunit
MEWGGGEIPALSARNVKMGYIDFDEECYFGSDALHRRWMTNGDTAKDDVVITMEAPLGNVALIPDARRYILSQRTILLRLKPSSAASQFIFQQMLSQRFQDLLAASASGSTAKGIQRRRFEKLMVIVPAVPEQRVIAKVLGDADALIASMEKLIAKKRDLKQAAMQELLTGRTRLPGFDEPWETKQFGRIVQLRKERTDPRTSGVEVFCVELEHVEQGSGRLLGSTVADRQSSLKSCFRVGDVLFGKLRAYLRKYWLADRDGVCSTEFWVLVAGQGQSVPEYLFHLVQSEAFIQAASVAYGTHMPRSDWDAVKDSPLAIPHAGEQVAIAEVLSDMDAEIAALKARLTKTRDVKQGMMQELLTGRTRLT